jgi:hypothetical protein
MNWHMDFQRRLIINDAPLLCSLLETANKQLARQNRALGQARAALIEAKAALAWYGAEAFESDGVTVGDRIDDALDELTH